MKVTVKFLSIATIVVAVVWYAGPGSAGEPSRSSEPAPQKHPTTVRRCPTAGGDGYHGIAWQIHHAADSVDTARTIFKEIAALGADTVLISNAGYQKHAGSDTFRIDPNITPSNEQWQEIFSIARTCKLRVILMPIILLSDPRGSEWRGEINPPSWDDWFEQYRHFLTHFARIAERGRVDVMMVGSELVSTEKYTDQWQRVIREVRGLYSGKLSYSANWDHYKVIEFWDDLDFVGMTSYYKLSSAANPPQKVLTEAWKPIRRGLLRWQKRIGKPLLFTEVGWASQSGAAIEPWNYYHDQNATPEALEEQRRCYRAFMNTWWDDLWPNAAHKRPAVGGAIWWEWNTSPGGPADYNYIPKGKPAERELQQWFNKIQQQRSQRAESKSAPNAAAEG